MAADLELDLLGLVVALDAGGYKNHGISFDGPINFQNFCIPGPLDQQSRTGSILPAADLKELLNIGDFARHDGGRC